MGKNGYHSSININSVNFFNNATIQDMSFENGQVFSGSLNTVVSCVLLNFEWKDICVGDLQSICL